MQGWIKRDVILSGGEDGAKDLKSAGAHDAVCGISRADGSLLTPESPREVVRSLARLSAGLRMTYT